MITQSQLEREMDRRGKERYRSRINEAKEKGRESVTVAGQSLLNKGVSLMTDHLRQFVKENHEKPGKNHVALGILDRYGKKIEVVAGITCRVILDSVSAKMDFHRASFRLATVLEDELIYRHIKAEANELWRAYSIKLKGQKRSWQRKAYRSSLKKVEAKFDKLTRTQKYALGMFLIETFIEVTGLFELEMLHENNKRKRNLKATPETLAWMEKAHKHHEHMYPVYLPMVEKPNNWTNLYNGGYKTNYLFKHPLIRVKTKKALRGLAGIEMDEVYSAVNIIQGTQWEVNSDVYQVLDYFWSNEILLGKLPQRSDVPVPEKPVDIDTNEEARIEWSKMAKEVRDYNATIRSRRLLVSRIISMAEDFKDLKFYYPYFLDFRGRIYPVPSFLQPQGEDISRGLLRFATGYRIENDEQFQWFQIQGANTYGEDKVSLEDRCKWVELNTQAIKEVYQDPIENRWWAEADKPWQFLAWCLEYGAYLEDPANFESKIPIHMDGSNNGLQLFSLLLRDPKGAEATNCIPCEEPQDIYQDVADKLTERLEEDGSDTALKWLDFCGGRIPRGACKRPVMTLPYGATRFSCHNYIMEWYQEEVNEKNKPRAFTNVFHPAIWLSHIMWDCIKDTIGVAQKCMDWLQEIADVCNQHKVEAMWRAPTGFLVKQSYTGANFKRIRTLVGDTYKYLYISEPNDKLNTRKQRQGISPNFVHSLDASILHRTVIAAARKGVNHFSMVHDSYGVHAAHAPMVAEILREVCVDLFSTDLLLDFREQIAMLLPAGVDLPAPPPVGTFKLEELKESKYFFA